MNKFMKFFAGCFLMLAMMSLTIPQSQDTTELKMINGTQESAGLKVVVAIMPTDDSTPKVSKVLEFKAFGDVELLEIPSSEQIVIGAVSIDTEIAPEDELSAEYVETFQPITLEKAKRCNITAKGTLADGVNFTLSNIEW